MSRRSDREDESRSNRSELVISLEDLLRAKRGPKRIRDLADADELEKTNR